MTPPSLTITLQAVPERLEMARSRLAPLAATYPVVESVDTERSGSFASFVRMLAIPHTGYRLHVQDDIEFAPRLAEYLPRLVKQMEATGWPILSLFAPRRANLATALQDGHRIVPFVPFLWLQACIFSPSFIRLLQQAAPDTKEKDDDVFVADVLRKHRLRAMVHLPSLVQHDVGLPSTLGHANSKHRTSDLYDPMFLSTILPPANV